MAITSTYSRVTRSLFKTIDWWIVVCFLFLVLFGWINIYASDHNAETVSIFSWSCRSGKQFVWILLSLISAGVILFAIPPKAYEPAAPILYAVTVLLLVAVIFLGSSINGSHSWFVFGPVSFQPAEISKITTSLLLASIMSRGSYRMTGKNLWQTFSVILLPVVIILAEKETGSALVYLAFLFVLYREGMSGWTLALLALVITLFIVTVSASTYVAILILLFFVTLFDMAQIGNIGWWVVVILPFLVGTLFTPEAYATVSVTIEAAVYAGWSVWKAFRIFQQRFRWYTLIVLAGGMILIFSAEFIFNNVLKDYQRNRIEILLGMKEDFSGVGYNVIQSKIAIGSGGLWGKGFCHGTQTAYGFVPEQSTDFIFCTVGEEWGFAGCLAVIAVYFILIWRIVYNSERTRGAFTRIYGYCLAGCLFMHIFINIGMTLGIVPVIGIPLPFMSYGGSSICAFSIMLFIFVALIKNERRFFR